MIAFLTVILVAIMLMPTESISSTYYVRTDGNDVCNGLYDVAGTSGNCAKRTIQASINVATTAGDTVTIHAGDYTDEGRIQDAASGNSGNPITIQSATGETVIVANMRTDYSYTKFSGLTFTNPGTSADGGGSCIILSGGYGEVSNCYIPGDAAEQYKFGVLFDGGSFNNVNGNIFEGHFWIVFAMHRPYNIMENNIIRDITDVERIWDGIFTSSSNSNGTIIRGNEVSNFTTPGIYFTHADIIQVVNQGGTSSANDWIIEDNYFHDCDAQIGINEAAERSTGWIFRNNVFANINLQMMLLVPNTKVYNNTFFQCGQMDTHIMDIGESGVDVRNNILIGRSTTPTLGMINVTGGSPTLGYNFFSLPRSSLYTARDSTTYLSLAGTGSINGGDPKFVAVYDDCVNNTCNFNLQSDSPLIGVGATLTGYVDDKSGATRSVPWDIGAYEYVAPLSSTISNAVIMSGSMR